MQVQWRNIRDRGESNSHAIFKIAFSSRGSVIQQNIKIDLHWCMQTAVVCCSIKNIQVQ